MRTLFEYSSVSASCMLLTFQQTERGIINSDKNFNSLSINSLNSKVVASVRWTEALSSESNNIGK